MAGTEERAATFRQVFALREFQAVFAGQLVSVAGDQLARVALSVLVFDRTKSPGWSALTYALTYLPDVVAGPLLSGLADRWPRRQVMVVADVARAVTVALMAIPGMPLVLVGVLLVLVQSIGAPGNAARAATLAVALVGDRYVLGKSVMDITIQLSQVIGFATGGILVAGIGVSQGLLADAATFLASASLVRLGIRARPKPSTPGSESERWWPSLRAGAVLVATTPKLRALVAVACVAGFYVTVEGLAAPYAAEIGGGPQALGLLLAASPAGAVVGMWIVSRWAPATRLRLLGPLAIGSCVPLTLCALHPGLSVTVLLWFLSGAASAYHLPASAEFVRAVPDHRRGQAFGLAAAALKTSQGLGIVLVGVGAEYAVPSTVIAVTGGLGVVAAAAAGLAWRRARREPTAVGSGTADPA